PRIAEIYGGSKPRLTCVLVRQVREEGAACILDEETRELGARFILRPDDVADARCDEVLGGSHDRPGHLFQETVALFQGEGELAARTAPRQFPRHRKPRRPDDQEGHEAADDEEVREADLVELAMVPEARDEDEGQEEQEEGADRERAETSVHASPDRPGDLEPP